MKANNKSIIILGTKYKIKYSNAKINSKLVGNAGYVELEKKEIILDETDYSNSYKQMEKVENFYKSTLRHEIIHAIFYESGLSAYAGDEVLVDWLAMQFPKLNEIFKKLKVD